MPGVSWAASLVLCSLLSFTMIKHTMFHCLIVKGIQQRSLSSSLLPASEQRCVSLFAQPPLEQSTAVSEGGHSHSKVDPLLFFSCPVAVPTGERSAPVIGLCSAARPCASGTCFLSALWSWCKRLCCPQKQQRQISSLERNDSDCYPHHLFHLSVQQWVDKAVHPHPPSTEQCLGLCWLCSELDLM